MLLQSILDQFDEELARLFALRTIIADLATPLPTEPEYAAEDPPLEAFEPSFPVSSHEREAVAKPTPMVAVEGKTRLPRRSRRPARILKLQAEKTQPVKPLPSGPVVVSAAQLERERALRNPRPLTANTSPAADAPQRDLHPESAARLLSARWLAGGRPDGPLPLA